ncbi:MAG: hypothetical protein ACXABO_14545 [Promethearchaeota archaeon]|jgi:hypothetical protein
MVYIITTVWFPPSKRVEIAKKAIEVAQKTQPDPSISTLVVPNAIMGSPNGITSLSISEVKEGKLEEALNLAVENIMEYMDIEGYNYKIDLANTLTEAMTMLDLKMPE